MKCDRCGDTEAEYYITGYINNEMLCKECFEEFYFLNGEIKKEKKVTIIFNDKALKEKKKDEVSNNKTDK